MTVESPGYCIVYKSLPSFCISETKYKGQGYTTLSEFSFPLDVCKLLTASTEKDLFGAKYNYLMSIVNLKYFSGLIKDADLLEINQFLIK